MLWSMCRRVLCGLLGMLYLLLLAAFSELSRTMKEYFNKTIIKMEMTISALGDGQRSQW